MCQCVGYGKCVPNQHDAENMLQQYRHWHQWIPDQSVKFRYSDSFVRVSYQYFSRDDFQHCIWA